MGYSGECWHLLDLEPLWHGGIKFGDCEFLREAGLTNSKTNDARHNKNSIEVVLNKYRFERKKLIKSIIGLSKLDLNKTPLHPRLKSPMRIVDLLNFITEHDDRHLAQITYLKSELKKPPTTKPIPK